MATTGRTTTASGGFGGALTAWALAALEVFAPITLALTGATGAAGAGGAVATAVGATLTAACATG